MVGNGYRPQSIMGGFLSADNLRYLAEKENIHVAHAVIWSQHNIDGGGADGSPSYPSIPRRNTFASRRREKAIHRLRESGWLDDGLYLCPP